MPKIPSEEKSANAENKSGTGPAAFTILKATEHPSSSSSPSPVTENQSSPMIKIATRSKAPATTPAPEHNTQSSTTPISASASTSTPTPDAGTLVKGIEALDLDEDGNENESTFDEFLITALKNRNDRIFLLKLELEFTNFINNQSQDQLDFPSLNSYYRMVIHRVANYFKLTRVVDPLHKTIIMYKTDQSAIPALRFSDLMEEEEEQTIKPMKLLKRAPTNPPAGASPTDSSSEPDRRTISIKEREEAYARARARIFQEDVPAKPKSPEEGSSNTNARSDSPSTRSDPLDESTKAATKAKKPVNGRKSSQESKTADETVPEPEVNTFSSNHSNNASLPSSRDVSRSTSPSLDTRGSRTSKPKSKHSKSDLAVECADARRRKSATSTTSYSSSSTLGNRTHIHLARTVSSSSSQDGTQSPSLASTLTESPVANSPSNPMLGKGHDYFGQNPHSNTGSVSPMGSASSRTSGSFSHNSGSKQYRNQHSGGISMSNNSNSNNSNINNNNNNNSSSTNNMTSNSNNGSNSFNTSNSGFSKGMNTQPFVPKKAHGKHGPSGHHNNTGGGPNGAMNNNSNGIYNNQYPGMVAPWPDRHQPHGQDLPGLYNPAQDISVHGHGAHNNQPPQPFAYGPGGHQLGPPMQTPFGPGHQQHYQQQQQQQHPPFFHTPHRQGSGARRYHTSHPQFHPQHSQHSQHNHNQQHQQHSGQHHQHYGHHQHARTHPPTHLAQHPMNNHPSTSRDEFAFSQGMQNPQRFDRPYDNSGNNTPTPLPSFQHGPDFSQVRSGNDTHPSQGPMFPPLTGHAQTPSSQADGP
ncbi:R3H domain-containing protein 1, partial [Podila epigama]